MRHRAGLFSRQKPLLSKHRVRGVGSTEYVLYLSLTILVGSLGYKQYGPELRQHAAKMSERFATYYYEGWFWPEDDLATSGGSGTPRAGSGTGSNGSPSDGAPSSPGSSGGGNPLAGGSGSPSAGEGGGTSGGQTGNAGSGGNPNTGTGGSNPFGNNGQSGGGDPFNNNTGGNGGNPQMCSASPGSNSSTQSFAGNPIDIGTGNKLQLDTDYIDSQPDGLPFIRSYNAYQGSTDIGIGHGWRHTWQREIRVTKDAVTVIRADGSHFVFSQAEAEYRAPVGVVDRLQRLDTGWQYTTGFGAIERYDDAGRLQQIAYPSGVSHLLHYDDNHTLTAVSDNRGARIVFGYDGDRLTRVTLPDGSNRLFTYDSADRLSAVYRVSGSVLPTVSQWLNKPSARYRYEDERFPYALTALDDATHPVFAAWAYDHLGRAIRSQHGNGAEKIDINYLDDTTVVVTNAAGHNTTYTLEAIGDGRRRVVAIDGEAGLTCPELRQRNRYDANGFLAVAVDGGDRARILERDARGLVNTEYDGVHIAPNGNWQPVEGSTQIDRRWHAQWPLATHTLRHRYHDGQWLPVQRSTYAYDDRGSLREEIHTDLLAKPESAPATRRWSYTRHYHDTEQTRLAALHVSDPLGHNTQLSYDPEGRLTATRNALGQETRFTDHTAARLPGKVLLPNGLTVRLQYDDQQRLTQIQHNDDRTLIGYQANGLVSRLQLANGSTFELSYNTARQLTGVRNQRGESQTLDPSALNGDWKTKTLFDSDGVPVRQHHRSQDEWGRLIGWLGNSGQLTELAYDKSGDAVATRERHEDPSNPASIRTTRAHYDTLHRLTALIDAAGARTELAYSLSGHVQTVVDANANTTRFERNGFGEVLKEINPARGDDHYRYDALGNTIQRNQTRFTYDALNRLIAIDAPGEPDDLRYHYDQRDTDHGNGIQQLTRIEAADHVIDYRYDDQGQLVGETTAPKKPLSPRERGWGESSTTLQYSYLPGGRLASIGYPDGSVVQYHYDAERITDVTYTDAATDDENTLVKDIRYAPFGGPQQWTYGSGLQQLMAFDRDGRVQAIELKQASLMNNTVLWTQRYGYDLYNNIERIEKDTTTQQFAYDEVHRLIGEQRQGTEIEFDYDGVGNRTRQEIADKTTDYQYSAGNRLTQRGDVSVALDGRGNLIEQGDQRFEYNSSQRPISFYQRGQLAARYGYNANGLRNSKTVYRNGKPITTRFAYAPDTKLLSAATANHITHYIWLGHTPIAQIEKTRGAKRNPETQITYLHPDHLLTPRVATNDQQKIIWRWDSDAFGGSKPDTDSDKDGKRTDIQLRFPGQYADEESGLYYNVFRYYDPQTGRYTQSDPIGLNGGLNSFAYVGGQPLAAIDPYGLKCVSQGGITTCTPENNLFDSFSVPTPAGWSDFEVGDSLFHDYLFEDDVGSGGCANYGDILKQELIKSPTNDRNAASQNGTLNDVGPLHLGSGVDNVKSYLRGDGIVNITMENHAVGSGFVMRKVVSNGSGGYKILTYGEGNSWKQAMPGANGLAESFWTTNAQKIKQHSGCRCSN